MSSTLVWEPKTNPSRHTFSNSVKFMLRKRYGEPLNCYLGMDDIPEDIREVIDAISRYGTIYIKEEY